MSLSQDRQQAFTVQFTIWGGYIGGGNMENQGPNWIGIWWILVWDTLIYQKMLDANFSSKMPTGLHVSEVTA